MLVAPVRCVPRMSQLSPEEISDLFAIVYKVTPVVEKVYGASSTTIVVQDGKDAGQTIEVSGYISTFVYVVLNFEYFDTHKV